MRQSHTSFSRIFSFMLLTLFTLQALAMVPIGEPVPDFTLTDQDNKPFTFSDLKGDVVVVSFLFTTCPYPDKCPMIARKLQQMADLKRKLGPERPLSIIAITLDPANDTPTVLKKYAAKVGFQSGDIHFLTGEPNKVRQVAEMFGITYWEENGIIEHNMVTSIVDQKGRLNKVITGSDFPVGSVMSSIFRLLP